MKRGQTDKLTSRLVERIGLRAGSLKIIINQKFWFVFEHTETLISPPQIQRPLALYQGPIFIHAFKKKDAYGKYLSFVIMGSYVVCLRAKVFKFP